MNSKLGEVWLVDLGLAAKVRPVIVVSRYDPAPPRALVLYVPVTTQNRDSKYEVELPVMSFLRQDSIANIQGLGSIPVVRLERKLGKLPDEAILKIKQALIFALDLEVEEQQDNQ
ncbi:type II toxin-antitoxin system PemK/MazF family toxin [Halotia branconii]|uniref:Type II toxin-antitoxin system PemK/MazF family toxin n=1 Tax=Halotia branconii CENA392 TaxID=1539056 RepID=A0AAJ6NNH7_9CYAN|nr:type II toxin-antitoxin system PemK/MazF family toxin [Halotia branconii]WGV23770.1 type II toxin-antitoxin system PemK/MazF family toxin [Halotia branconii CENA392]